jgi:hypothetical protein
MVSLPNIYKERPIKRHDIDCVLLLFLNPCVTAAR